MTVIAYDPYVSAERYKELGVDARRTSADLYAARRHHHDPPAQDRRRRSNFVNAEAFAQMKDGVRIVNCARGELLDLDALRRGARLGQGRRARASTSSRTSR